VVDATTTMEFDARMNNNTALRDQVYFTLRNAILEGSLRANYRLKQDEIARNMNVSRMPIREAFKGLEKEGLIKIVPHKGAWVSRLDSRSINEIYMLRGMLEPKAVTLAVNNFDSKSLERLIVLNKKFALMAEQKKFIEMIRLNKCIHFLIYYHSNTLFLKKMISELWSNFPRYTFNLISDQPSKSVYEHWNIIYAIKNKKAEEAGDLMNKHIENAKQALINEIYS